MLTPASLVDSHEIILLFVALKSAEVRVSNREESPKKLTAKYTVFSMIAVAAKVQLYNL